MATGLALFVFRLPKHYTTLRYTTLHYTSLHCTAPQRAVTRRALPLPPSGCRLRCAATAAAGRVSGAAAVAVIINRGGRRARTLDESHPGTTRGRPGSFYIRTSATTTGWVTLLVNNILLLSQVGTIVGTIIGTIVGTIVGTVFFFLFSPITPLRIPLSRLSDSGR